MAEAPSVEDAAPTEALSEIVSAVQASPAEVPLVERLEESVSAETILAAESSLAAKSSAGSEGEDHPHGSDFAVEQQPPALDAVATPASAITEPRSASDAPAVEAEGVVEPFPQEEPSAQESAQGIEAVTEATVEPVLQAVEAAAVAEPAPLPPATASFTAEAAKQAQHSFQIGANFIFTPSLAPFSEINAKLFAFARGESEAALAHLQALTRVKSPAEAIRLQVTELQRAADASLTCFSEIVRSANRLSDVGRWH